MKRLLAAGSGAIYQICRVFRNGELGPKHNPEFTMLEWYRPAFDYRRMMNEVADLINNLLVEPLPVESLSYAEAFQRYLAIEPHQATVGELRDCAMEQPILGAAELEMTDKDGWLNLLLSHAIEPHLGYGKLTFIYDYPASQASLARVRSGQPPVAERFELYLQGMEIANGFHELNDAVEQQQRFFEENRIREQRGLKPTPIDENLLNALEVGLPDCSGTALGVDRLLMFLQGIDDISQVLAFPLERA